MATRLDLYGRPLGQRPISTPYTGQQPTTPVGPAPLDQSALGRRVAPPAPGGIMPPHLAGTRPTTGISTQVPLPTGMTVGDLPQRGLPGAPVQPGTATLNNLLPQLDPATGLATPKTAGTWNPGITDVAPAAPTTPYTPGTGGDQPAVPFAAGPDGTGSVAGTAAASTVAPGQTAPGPGQTVNDMLNFFINGEYAENARRRGAEQANSRGLLNSSIAAGASERAALEAVQPFVQQGMGLLGDREQRAFQGQESQLDRVQGVNNMMLQSQIQERQAAIAQAYQQGNMGLAAQLQRDQSRDQFEFSRALQSDSVAQQDWLANSAFTREFNSALSMMPVTNAMSMFQSLMQAGIDDPEVFTPQYMSGMSNFFNNYMLSIFNQFGLSGQGGAGTLPVQPRAGGTP